MNAATGRPLLAFDGDCGFCTASAEFGRRRLHLDHVEPWQRLDLASMALTEEQCEQAVQWVAELLAASEPVRLACVFRGAATADLPSPEQIADLDVPTLILAWTGDAGHPVQTAARLQELMPHAELALAASPAGLDGWTERLRAFLAAA